MTINRLFSIGHFIFSDLKAEESISCLMRPVTDETQGWGNVCSQKSPQNPLWGYWEDKFFSHQPNSLLCPALPSLGWEGRDNSQTTPQKGQTANCSKQQCAPAVNVQNKKIGGSVCEWGWIGDHNSLTQTSDEVILWMTRLYHWKEWWEVHGGRKRSMEGGGVKSKLNGRALYFQSAGCRPKRESFFSLLPIQNRALFSV